MITSPPVSPVPADVLYVEDEENDVLFMGRALARAGLAVDLRTVCDGDKALAYLKEEPPYAGRPLPRLILLDLNLPARSGFEVLEWIRARPALNDIPVVVLSSSGRPEDRERAQRLGATAYFAKPAAMLRLVDVARELGSRWLAPESRSESDQTPGA